MKKMLLVMAMVVMATVNAFALRPTFDEIFTDYKAQGYELSGLVVFDAEHETVGLGLADGETLWTNYPKYDINEWMKCDARRYVATNIGATMEGNFEEYIDFERAELDNVTLSFEARCLSMSVNDIANMFGLWTGKNGTFTKFCRVNNADTCAVTYTVKRCKVTAATVICIVVNE